MKGRWWVAGGRGAGAGVGMSGAGIFACEANAKIVTARRGRVGGAGSGKCNHKRGYTNGWRGRGWARGRDFCAEGVAKIVTVRLKLLLKTGFQRHDSDIRLVNPLFCNRTVLDKRDDYIISL